MAYAGALFADACLRGLNGEPNVEEYSYVESNKTELPFFSTKVKLGTKGEQLNICSLPWHQLNNEVTRADGLEFCRAPVE